MKFETNINKIQNGMLFRIDKTNYVKIGEYYQSLDLSKICSFSDIKEDNISCIHKLNGDLLLKKNLKNVSIFNEGKELEKDLKKIRDGITFVMNDETVYVKVGNDCIKVNDDVVYKFNQVKKVDRIFTKSGIILFTNKDK